MDEGCADNYPITAANSGTFAEFIDPAYDYLHVPDAWNIAPFGGSSSIKIGISDDPVKLTATDFAGKITGIAGYDASPGGYSHGNGVTALAAAAGNNGVGTAGVCMNCSIVVANRYFGIGTVTANSHLYKMALLGAKVINMSWGGYYGSSTPPSTHSQDVINDIVNNYNVTLVAAAGNASSYSTSTSYHLTTGSPYPLVGMLYVFPASYDNVISVGTVTHFIPWTLPLCHTVGPGCPGYCCLNPINNKHYHGLLQDSISRDAIDSTDPYNPISVARNGFYVDSHNTDGLTWMHTTNDKVDIMSTGYSIYSYGNELNGSTNTESGTSFSAPIVTGTIGLMLSVNDCLVPQEVETVLKLTTKDIENMPLNVNFAGVIGAGKLEVFNAVNFVNEMKKSNGNATIKDHIFNRYSFRLARVNNNLTIDNVTFKDNCTADFSAKNQIVVKPGAHFKPNGSAMVGLKIDPAINVCTSAARVAAVDNKNAFNKMSKAYLYPNPNNGSFEVVLQNIAEFQNTAVNIEIIDINGRLIHQENATIENGDSSRVPVTVVAIQTGIYFVKLSANGHTETLRFIKN